MRSNRFKVLFIMISKEIIVFGFFISLMVVLLVLTKKSKNKRTEGIKNKAMQLGLSFSKDTVADFIPNLGTFKFLKEGQSRNAKNLMKSKKSDIDFSIFDFYYSSGTGQSAYAATQTIFFVKTDRFNLPNFSMTPESIFNKIADKLTKNDIDFERYPRFSKRYHLKGKDENAIRTVFSEKIIQFLEHKKETISIEAEGDKIIIYRRSEMVEPKGLAIFRDESLNVAQMFMTR